MSCKVIPLARTPMKSVYLDQNKWIDLARAHHGAASGTRFSATLQFLRDPDTRARVVLPLSAIHYIETATVGGGSKSRSRLGEVMWELSRGYTMAPHRLILDHELDVALARRFPAVSIKPFTLVDKGVAHAFGMDRQAYRMPEQVRSALPPDVVARFEGAAQLVMEESLLTGVGPRGITMPPFQMESPNVKFMHHLQTFHSRVSQLPRRQWEDALLAISMADILDQLNPSLHHHGIHADTFEALGKDGWRAFMLDLPTRRVDIQLHRQILKNPKLKPKMSDLEDWAGLGPAAAHLRRRCLREAFRRPVVAGRFLTKGNRHRGRWSTTEGSFVVISCVLRAVTRQHGQHRRVVHST
jgi:hypothetical protein